MFHPIVENDSVFIVSGIQGLLSPFKVLLLWPRIFDCLQRLCQQSLGIGCTTCIWSLCLNQSCVTKRCLNVSLAYRGCCNHCARLPASRAHLNLTRIGAMKQSEVTHIVMQWPAFFSFTFISLSFFYFPSFFFSLTSLSTSTTTSLRPLCLAARWGEDVCRCPGGEGEKSIVRVFEVFWKTSQGRRSCQGDR